MKIVAAGVAAIVAIVVVSFASPAVAHAATGSPEPNSTIVASNNTNLTSAQVKEVYKELSASDIPRSVQVENGVTVTSFNVGGSSLVVRGGTTDGHVHPNISGGTDASGLYVSLNRTDQTALINGGTVALGAAICAVSGPIVCAAVGTLLAIGATYLGAHGICPAKKSNLRLHVSTTAFPPNGCYATP